MFVNRYKILASSLLTAPTGSTMVLPFSLDFIPIDNSELVQTEFVDKETKNSINPIISYEKSKFTPYDQNTGQEIKEIKIKLWNEPGLPMTYSDLGVTNEDVKFRRNRFLNSFLRLSFYDSDQVTNTNFLFDIIYFTQIGSDQKDLTGCSNADPNCISPNPNYGNPLDVSSLPVSYLLSNPIILPNKMAEGYYLYWLNKDVENNPKNIYMRASMNNAVNGRIVQLYSVSDSVLPIYDPSLFEKLNVKYTIFKDNNDGVFKYNVDNTLRSININPNLMTINLYKLRVQ
jgi:hypothetical protein